MSDQLTFPILTNTRYASAVERAKQSVKDRLQPPRFEQFKSGAVSEYPRWFFVATLAALFAVLLFSFVISAGKQAAAAGMLFDHLPSKFGRLSEVWATLSVTFMLLLSELGAVLFLVGAGTLATAAPKSNLAGRQVNLTAWLFRLFAVLCAGYAIIANATITVLDPVPQAAFLQWAVSIGVPAIVLGLGVMLERLLIDAMRTRNEQFTRYKRALLDYEAVQTDPSKHAEYPAAFASELWSEMIRYKQVRETLETLVSADPQNRRRILATEYQAQRNIADVQWEVSEPIPFLLPTPAQTVQ